MKKLSGVVLLAVLLCIAFGCQKKAEEPQPAAAAVDIAAEKAAVQAYLDESVKVLEAEDLEWYARTMAHDDDMVNFGTDEAEYWVGFEALKQSMAKQFEATENAKGSYSDVRIKVHKSGEVAWVTGFMNFSGSSMGQPFDIKARMTNILEKRDGRWICVHMHVSAPVAGQLVKY